MQPTIRLPNTSLLAHAATIALFGLGACGRGGEGAGDTAGATAAGATGAATTPAPTAAPTLNDAQIAQVAVTANSVDSAAGAAARPKARNAQVREFAQQMVRDHGALNKQATALAQRLNLTPADNDMSRQLQQTAEQTRTNLANRTGAEFDRAYIDSEVQAHQTVLDALDRTLIPGAQNAELKTLLQQARGAVAGHLEKARSIQGTLGRQ